MRQSAVATSTHIPRAQKIVTQTHTTLVTNTQTDTTQWFGCVTHAVRTHKHVTHLPQSVSLASQRFRCLQPAPTSSLGDCAREGRPQCDRAQWRRRRTFSVPKK